MCGFSGFIDSRVDNKKTIIEAMTETIKHRGPDSAGVYTNQDFAIGFRRLSIVDLSTDANQPFVNSDESIVLSFNGEIYNYKEIRADLMTKGIVFNTEAEGEVLLRAFETYGIDFVKYLRGMYAIVIWETKRKNLYLVRDPFGIKPLYYCFDRDQKNFIFGSEIKSFLKHPDFVKVFNKDALEPYLSFQYSALEETFFKGVFKVAPGHYLSFNEGNLHIAEFATLSFESKSVKATDAINNIHETLKSSVAYHKQSDVPVGAFLSGGIDSSYLTALLKPEKTFSVGFSDYEDMFNETAIAAELSKKLACDHHIKIVNPDEFFEALPKIQYHMDEPHANLSAVPLYFLSELARKHVTVVLSGEGADELFGGYDWYKESFYRKAYAFMPQGLKKGLAKISAKLPNNRVTRFIEGASQPLEETFIGQAYVFKSQEAKKMLKADYHSTFATGDITGKYYQKVKHKDNLTKMQYLDLHQWLPGDILQKADKMSMAHSIELRVPFLDREVMASAANLPQKLRMHKGISKYALRQASYKVLDEAWATRPKVGFPVPIKHWLKIDKYYNMVKDEFNTATANEFFNTHVLNTYLDQHFSGHANHARYIYTVYVFLVWYKSYFK